MKLYNPLKESRRRVTKEYTKESVVKGVRDVASIPFYVLKYLGKGVERLFGYTAEKVKGKPIKTYKERLGDEAYRIEQIVRDVEAQIETLESRYALNKPQEERLTKYRATRRKLISRLHDVTGEPLEDILERVEKPRLRFRAAAAAILLIILSGYLLASSTPSLTGYSIVQAGTFYTYFPFLGTASLIVAFILLLSE